MASQVGFGPRAVVWNTLVWTMKRSGDSTHHFRGPTPTLNGCELTPSTWAQSFEQDYSYLTASKRHPSAPYSHNNPQSFSRVTRPYTFPRSTKHVCSLWHAPRISRKFAGEWKFDLYCYGHNKAGLGIIQLWFNYFRGILA